MVAQSSDQIDYFLTDYIGPDCAKIAWLCKGNIVDSIGS